MLTIMHIILFRCLDSVKHFKLSCDNGKLFFGAGEFSSVGELLTHFQNYPIIGGETGGLLFLCYSLQKVILPLASAKIYFLMMKIII